MDTSTATSEEQRAALSPRGVARFDLLKDADDRAYILSIMRRVVTKKRRKKKISRGGE